MSTANWTEDFQRLVIAAAVGGDLLGQLPLDPALFGSLSPVGATSPRQRLAEIVVKYFGEYGARPSPQAFSQLALEVGAGLGPEERAGLESEAAAVLRIGAPTDQEFVRDRVRAELEHDNIHHIAQGHDFRRVLQAL